jgi:hypothetical protein
MTLRRAPQEDTTFALTWTLAPLMGEGSNPAVRIVTKIHPVGFPPWLRTSRAKTPGADELCADGVIPAATSACPTAARSPAHPKALDLGLHTTANGDAASRAAIRSWSCSKLSRSARGTPYAA